MTSSISGASGGGCKYEEIDDGRLRICFCEKSDCFLGEGSYAKVFKATEMQGEKGPVAIKYPTGPCHVEHEIATLKSVNHHNILKYHREFKLFIHQYVLYLLFII